MCYLIDRGGEEINVTDLAAPEAAWAGACGSGSDAMLPRSQDSKMADGTARNPSIYWLAVMNNDAGYNYLLFIFFYIPC